MDLKLIPYTIILIAFGAAFILHTTPPMPHPPQYDIGDVLVAPNASVVIVADYFSELDEYLLVPVDSIADVMPPLDRDSGVWHSKFETERDFKKIETN